ncbi:hypothetical protein DM02DRAFT_612074 [Periconia macrospinosa]|uniref:Uncharacterized protein n=1 Tax=Periconia macrospinosa TaxID=97972 RepID=A0A2V1DZE4_9PLEO|nr:hypothetical protein DM02DRAFT_612074 [Periconia macrospinosa]
MPLPKRQTIAKASQKPRAKPSEDQNPKDDRFANFETDPKFRLPSKKQAKTKLDPRFSRLRTDPDFQNKAPVDKYGRRVTKEEVKKNLGRLFGSDDEASEASGDDDEEEQLNTAKAQRRDQAVRKELAKAQKRGLDPIRDGGLSSSSEESSSDEDEEEEEVEDQVEIAGDGNDVPTGDVTARLAAVNMDWDNIRATDIMAVANSFLPADGRIRNVVIYPSEFGLERMQREEIEGPPKEIFAAEAESRKKDITDVSHLEEADSDDAGEDKRELANGDEGEDFDSKALRTYQIDRLRYYYAVITCSSANAAKAIYDNLDGREYLSSANFFDLRFVPDDVDFDAEPHDECEDLPNGYKPNEFITGALSHSKVKLTWDADDTTRKEVQKRAFSRKEIDENELQAYLGADSSSSEDEAATAKADKAASLRAALGLGPAGSSKSSSKPKSSSKRDRDFQKPDGEMEVTFTSGLSNTGGTKGSVFENEPEETTLEKYVRRQKERKEKRKQRYLAIKEGRDPDAIPSTTTSKDAPNNTNNEDEDPWNDPFFASDPETTKPSKPSKKSHKHSTTTTAEDAAAAAEQERANLELLMLDDNDNDNPTSSTATTKMQHFNMNEILKAEKQSSSSSKKKKSSKYSKPSAAAAAAQQDTFEMNTSDPRFAKLYESHEFAIDPTNPRFVGTKGMKALLEEGRRKRKVGGAREEEEEEEDGRGGGAGERKKARKSKGDADAGEGEGDKDSLRKLAERVRAKSLKGR